MSGKSLLGGERLGGWDRNMDASISALVLHAAFKTELNESGGSLLIMESKCAEYLPQCVVS
jgi:hypothetical protein